MSLVASFDAVTQDLDGNPLDPELDALGEIGGPTATQLLDYASVADADESVREAAADWLEELRDEVR